MQSVFPMRDRSERLFRGALAAPARRHEAHAGDALYRAHHIDAAADRPPALSRLLHEAEALEPASLGERRRVAAEVSAVQLEAEEREPVLESHQADVPS